MNKDIRVRTTFPNHPKTKKLIRKLGHEGFYSLVSLWCFIAENKPNGILKNMDIEDIAIASNWAGDAELFVDLLIRCGFLEKDDGGQLCVHDWVEHNAYAAFAPLRSQIARQNVLKRWEKKQKTINTGKPLPEANLIPSVLPVDISGNTPIPSPIPIPFPSPFHLTNEQKKEIEGVLETAFEKGYSQQEIHRYFSEQVKNDVDIETAIKRLTKKIQKKEKLNRFSEPARFNEILGATV